MSHTTYYMDRSDRPLTDRSINCQLARYMQIFKKKIIFILEFYEILEIFENLEFFF